MLRKISLLAAILFVFASFSGCGPADRPKDSLTPEGSDSALPGMMVQFIDVGITPEAPGYQRHYQSQKNLNAVLNLLRDMVTSDHPQDVPPLGFGQTYFTITATYATGQQQQYVLLNNRFLKMGDDPWCEISRESAMAFTAYIQEHPSDDGSDPTQPSLPGEDNIRPVV